MEVCKYKVPDWFATEYPALYGLPDFNDAQRMQSWSIKAVLPTIAPDLDHASIEEARDGTAAQMAYLEVIYLQTNEIRKQELFKILQITCGVCHDPENGMLDKPGR